MAGRGVTDALAPQAKWALRIRQKIAGQDRTAIPPNPNARGDEPWLARIAAAVVLPIINTNSPDRSSASRRVEGNKAPDFSSNLREAGKSFDTCVCGLHPGIPKMKSRTPELSQREPVQHLLAG